LSPLSPSHFCCVFSSWGSEAENLSYLSPICTECSPFSDVFCKEIRHEKIKVFGGKRGCRAWRAVDAMRDCVGGAVGGRSDGVGRVVGWRRDWGGGAVGGRTYCWG
jgi:hypothetical protein